MVTVYTYFYKQKSRLLMEAAGPLFYSFSDFELVLIAAFANQITNANIKNIRPLTPFESEIRSEKQKKKPSPARIPHRMRAVALAEGFEPSDSLPSSVFWTDFINHSNKQADGAEGEVRTHMPRFPRRQLSKLLPYR